MIKLKETEFKTVDIEFETKKQNKENELKTLSNTYLHDFVAYLQQRESD